MKKRVVDILVETLAELEVKDCFCVVGGGAMHINNAFKINNSINVTYCHHEQACAFAAEGYAKMNNQLSVVSVTSGPGSLNTLNGVQGAYVDNTPMFVVAGFPRYETSIPACGLKLRCRGVQEFDIIPAVQGMTKYAKMILDPLSIKKEVINAYKIAMDGRRGPVWLTIPLDIQAKIVETDELYKYEEEYKEIQNHSDEINKIINMLQEAKRPVILAGSALRSAGAIDKFKKLIKKIDIPIVSGAVCADILYKGHDNYYGLSGSTGPRVGNYILQESDLILILGNSMSTNQTGFNVEGFAPKSKLIMIDIEKDEPLKPGLNIDMPVQMDINQFITEMDEKIETKITCPTSWKTFCDKIYNKFVNYDIPNNPDDSAIKEKAFWNMFLDKLPNDAVIALGNSLCVSGILQLGIRKPDQRVIVNNYSGSMGDDLPEAVGVAIASGKSVYCVTGDGSIMMNLQELETIKYHNLPIKIIIFSNQGYGTIRQTCKKFFNGVYTGCDNESGIDFPSFEKIADAFEFHYMKCERYGDLENTINDLINFNDRCILEITQDIDDKTIPAISSKMNADGTFETPSFIDLSPFLNEADTKEYEELKKELYNI